jgi:hypothetical protein
MEAMEDRPLEDRPLALSAEQFVTALLLTVSANWAVDCDCPITPELLRAGLEASLDSFHNELLAAVPRAMQLFFSDKNVS